MLNQKICLVDFSEQAYGFNQLYTQVLPRPQLDLLYLATALAVRPNQITVLSERDDSRHEAQISFAPLPADPASYWAEAGFDAVVCLDSLEGADKIRPYLPPETPLVLWSHLPAKHVAMLPLQHASVQAAWATMVFESFYQLRNYFETFGLRPEQVAYRWPAIVRSLRKRFTNTEQLATARAPQPTMAFTAEPAHGLAQALELHEALKAENPGLRLRVMLKPGFEAAAAPAPVRELIARARTCADVEVFDPLPWPSYVERLLGCHLLCHPLAFQDPNGSEMLDALGAGCLTVLPHHPALAELSCDQIVWIQPDPAESYFERYREALAGLLSKLREEPARQLEQSFRQIAHMSTYFTWDLRVWEWETLFFRLKHPEPEEPPSQPQMHSLPLHR